MTLTFIILGVLAVAGTAAYLALSGAAYRRGKYDGRKGYPALETSDAYLDGHWVGRTSRMEEGK